MVLLVVLERIVVWLRISIFFVMVVLVLVCFINLDCLFIF